MGEVILKANNFEIFFIHKKDKIYSTLFNKLEKSIIFQVDLMNIFKNKFWLGDNVDQVDIRNRTTKIVLKDGVEVSRYINHKSE